MTQFFRASRDRAALVARNFENLVTIPSFESYVKTRDAPGLGDEYVLVLLRHQGILRDTYYFNLRPRREDDDVYAGKWGLFGGKIEKARGNIAKEDENAAAEREIREETGLQVGQDFSLLAELVGYNSESKRTKGIIFLKILRKSPYREIKSYLKSENPRLRSTGKNEIGEVRVVHRWRLAGHFFLRWWRLTPQAIYALRDALERDPTRAGS